MVIDYQPQLVSYVYGDPLWFPPTFLSPRLGTPLSRAILAQEDSLIVPTVGLLVCWGPPGWLYPCAFVCLKECIGLLHWERCFEDKSRYQFSTYALMLQWAWRYTTKIIVHVPCFKNKVLCLNSLCLFDGQLHICSWSFDQPNAKPGYCSTTTENDGFP